MKTFLALLACCVACDLVLLVFIVHYGNVAFCPPELRLYPLLASIGIALSWCGMLAAYLLDRQPQ